MKSRENLLSAWAVLLGIIVAIILGISQKTLLKEDTIWIYAVLAVLGVIIGLASVRDDYKDATTFLMATVSLVIVSYMGNTALKTVGNVGDFIAVVLNALLVMFIPATIIVSIKTVFSVASLK
ncbi:hypothetical protein HYW74_00650 [Candidatus Pacearchaeota archaeon]|nr:hypothetical protein [Candidatus Pacearchaeota archaeon]